MQTAHDNQTNSVRRISSNRTFRWWRLPAVLALASVGVWGTVARGEDNITLTISGVISNNAGNDYFVGDSGTNNSLVISAGGVFTNIPDARVGNLASASNNHAQVTGNGSVWYIAGDLNVGESGAGNTMTIASGGAVYCAAAAVGLLNSANNNTVTVTGPGSVWNIYPNNVSLNTLYIGDLGANNSLIISNGGTVADSYGLLGGSSSASNNTVTVTGAGSVWNNTAALYIGLGLPSTGNTLTISNGGTVYNAKAAIGFETNSINNAVTVTGPGSVWNNSEELAVGAFGVGNVLIITNGGVAYNADGIVGKAVGASNNTATVTGPGSIWNNNDGLYVGEEGASNRLLIATGGSVLAKNVYIGFSSTAFNNQLTIAGGSLYVTNAYVTAVVDIRLGSLTLNSGTATFDQLLLTNNPGSAFTFNGGVLNTAATLVTTGQTILVGDGIDAANYHLLGGTHSFASGLRIRSNGTLSGCGTVTGNVAVDLGGLVLANCGGTLTFTGILTNNGTLRVANGVLETYSALVNNGTIDMINGATNFHGAFINNGTVLDATSVNISAASIAGQDFVVQAPSVLGHTYQLQYTASLTPTNWINTGSAQPGTGGVLTFTDPGGATNEPARFYHLQVQAQ